MLELLLIAPLIIVGLVVLSAVALVGHVVGFLIVLPFKLLGAVFRFVGFLLALPFLLVGGLLGVGGLVLGIVLVSSVLFLPIIPFAIAIAAIVWLVRRSRRTRAVAA
ncbi:MAG: hypothetical protein ACREOU_03985 [Candidatus Eiseniibacteriota bacterium]